MRLFIAINFNEEIKDKLCDIMGRLKEKASKGNFTLRENLHLTVVFIGEVPQQKIDSIKTVMDKVKEEPFIFNINGLGSFRREGESIYWIGVEKNDTLSLINQQLSQELNNAGFHIEKRDFRPHLTLGRRVVVDNSFSKDEFIKSITAMEMKADKISLMKSERINGKLTYTEIYCKYIDKID